MKLPEIFRLAFDAASLGIFLLSIFIGLMLMSVWVIG